VPVAASPSTSAPPNDEHQHREADGAEDRRGRQPTDTPGVTAVEPVSGAAGAPGGRAFGALPEAVLVAAGGIPAEPLAEAQQSPRRPRLHIGVTGRS
jgi:hypothetical protein